MLRKITLDSAVGSFHNFKNYFFNFFNFNKGYQSVRIGEWDQLKRWVQEKGKMNAVFTLIWTILYQYSTGQIKKPNGP